MSWWRRGSRKRSLWAAVTCALLKTPASHLLWDGRQTSVHPSIIVPALHINGVAGGSTYCWKQGNTPWTGRHSITGCTLTTFTLKMTPRDNLESAKYLNMHAFGLWGEPMQKGKALGLTQESNLGLSCCEVTALTRDIQYVHVQTYSTKTFCSFCGGT